MEDKLNPVIDRASNTLKDINAIKEFKSKLIDGSDNQYGLAKVLQMLTTSYNVVVQSLKNFNGISFDTEENRSKAKDIILDGKMHVIEAELRGARSRCDIIGDIYNDFLLDWFNSAKLEAEQLNALKNLFEDKLTVDDIFVDEMDTVGGTLREASEHIYPLIQAGDFVQAESKVKEFSQKLDPSLDRLSIEWKKLAGLEADFRQKLK